METLPEIAEILESTFTYDEYRLDYSGRGMNGKKCIGLITNDPWAAHSKLINCIELIPSGTDYRITKALEHMAHYEDPVQDDMGRSKILYWPGIHVMEE